MGAHKRLAFCLFLCFCELVLATYPLIQVKNSKLFVNGLEYIIKGVNYSPAPLGQQSMSNGYGGTGLCSAKLTPWGEWKSACFDSDYYDGSSDINPSRFSQGFQSLWERDLPQIKQTGANTIRLYNTNPSTRAATQEYKNLFPYPTGKDHTQFVKYCEKNGLMIIYPLISDEYTYNTADEYTFKRYLRWQIDEVGNSSAILMWQFGNEMGWAWSNGQQSPTQWNDPTATAKFNKYLAYIRRYTLSKWGRTIPITSCIPNFLGQYNYQFQNWHVDVFSANIFGSYYDYLFNGNGNDFAGITALTCMYNKPFLMTEIGVGWGAGVPYPQGMFNEIWASVVKALPNGMIGALWFEFTDEPALGKDFGFFGLQQNTLVDGETSTTADNFVADKLVAKQQYYDAWQGKYNGQACNLQSDLFVLMGRSASSFNNVTDRCNNFKICPGSGYPKCSGNGICDRTAGTCTCASGWSGTTCSTAQCPTNGRSTCSGHGVCSTLVTPPECICNAGFYGAACELTITSVPANTCPNGCSKGSGVCNITSTGAYACFCHSGWTGVDCSVHDVGIGSINIQQNYIACLKAPNLTVVAPSLPALTNQKCRYYCATHNYTYAGTYGGGKCLCGNSFASSVTTQLCTFACTGDSRQLCGGSTQVSTYYSGNAYGAGYLGCFVDDNTRDFSFQFYIGAANTIDYCRSSCSNLGYLYAGLQNSNECWCGNSYGNRGGRVSDDQCNAACAGDSSLFCGAGWRNSVYTALLPSGYAYY